MKDNAEIPVYSTQAFGATNLTFLVNGTPAVIKAIKPIDGDSAYVELVAGPISPEGIHPTFKKHARSQTSSVKDYLLQGNTITPLEALEMFGCFRLAAIIASLKKQGMVIHNDNPKDAITGKRYAKYYL